MVQEKTGDTMKFEVESRLDDLFGETEGGTETENEIGTENEIIEESEGVSDENTDTNEIAKNIQIEPEILEIHEEGVEMDEGHPLEDLKSTVLSIDWEITDEVMSRFVDQVEGLKREFKNNKIYILFLQLLGYKLRFVLAHKSPIHD